MINWTQMNADLQDLLNCLKNKKEPVGRVLICVYLSQSAFYLKVGRR